MISQLKLLLGALSFLSIIPIPGAGKLSTKELGRTAAYFPVAGLIIGALAAAVALALDQALPTQAANALVVLFLVVISGGLHLDGLADSVDALAGGRTKAKRLSIMHGGASGPLGVAAVTLALLLKYSFFNNLTHDARIVAVMAVPSLSRWPMVLMAWQLPSARKSGLGRIFAEQTRIVEVVIATAAAAGVCAAVAGRLGWRYIMISPLLALVAWAAGRWTKRMVGGVTGDTLGATVEVAEIMLILAFGLLV